MNIQIQINVYDKSNYIIIKILGLHIQTARCKHLVQFVIDKHKCCSLQNIDYTETDIIKYPGEFFTLKKLSCTELCDMITRTLGD